jgi:hypothetical protein
MARKRSILYLTNKGLQLDLSAHALSKLLARYEIFKMVLNLPGDIIDCGVYRDASLFSWGNLIEIFAPHSQKVVIGFDTFSGFSSDLHIEEDRDHSIKLMEDPTRFLPRSMDQIMSVANTLNLSHRFRLISGDAVKTIARCWSRSPLSASPPPSGASCLRAYRRPGPTCAVSRGHCCSR